MTIKAKTIKNIGLKANFTIGSNQNRLGLLVSSALSIISKILTTVRKAIKIKALTNIIPPFKITDNGPVTQNLRNVSHLKANTN